MKQKHVWIGYVPLILQFAFVILVMAAAYPAWMSTDSLIQYQQGLTNEYTDWHPPLMAFLLGVNHRVFGSPWLWTFAQVTMMSFLPRIFFNILKSNVSKIILTLCLFLPQVINFSGVMWKDIFCTVCLVMACYVNADAKQRNLIGIKQSIHISICVLLCIIAILIRLASAPFVLLILIFCMSNFRHFSILNLNWKNGLNLISTVLASLFAVSICSVILTAGLNPVKTNPIQYTYI